MLPQLRIRRGALLLGLALLGCSGCAATPLPGWRVSASIGGCEPHRGVVVADAEGVAREVADARGVVGDRLGSLPTNLDVTRGEGGWWLLGYVDRLGHLWWLADDADAPERVATGPYAGVVEAGGERLAVRQVTWGGWGAAERWAMVIDRLEHGPEGWTTTEVARFDDVRPHRAIADERGRALVLVELPAWSYEDLALVRVEGDRLRPVGWLPSDLAPGYQLSRTADAGLVVSTLWPADYPYADVKRPTVVLRKLDDDRYVAGALVRGCRGQRLPSSARVDPLPDPLRDGLLVNDNNVAFLLPTYADLGAIVDQVNTLPRPLVLSLGAVDLRGRDRELLRLEPGVYLDVYKVPAGISDARPDLFEPPAR